MEMEMAIIRRKVFCFLHSLNVNYFFSFVAIAYLWMPDTNNRRLGLEQLDTEDMEDGDVEMHNNDEQVLQWAEENVGDKDAPLPTTFATDKLIEQGEVEELN